jgi:GT2 family glycosyltransferase
VDRRQAERLAGRATAVASGPELALLVVVDRPTAGRLGDCLGAIASQTSPRWRLALSVVGPLQPAASEVLAAALGRMGPTRVTVGHLPGGTPAVQAMADLLGACAAPAFSLLGQHDVLAPDAVELLAAGLSGADLAYADEDRTDAEGRPYDPVLKPDWSPTLCLTWPYTGRPVAMRRDPVLAVGGIRPVAGGDWEHDLVLRLAERGGTVTHVAEVLCHRPDDVVHPDTGNGAVVAALSRRDEDAQVEPGPLPRTWRVRRLVRGRPSVTAIIPFRDTPELLRACVDSVVATAGDCDLDLLLVDNGSEEPETFTLLDRLSARVEVTVRRDPRPFNWAALNNAAAGSARGEVLLFLNNDIEARRPGWLGALVAQAVLPPVGAVGARLLYPGGRVQHAGVVVGLGGAAGHVLAGLGGEEPGYLGMAVLTRDCSSVTGACLATRRDVFDELGGFDEALGLDLNDIDYCLRARALGLHVVYEPLAELVHHESPSRGTSGSPEDQGRFVRRWAELVAAGDPYLNQHLTRMDFSAGLRTADEEKEISTWLSNLPA